MEMEKGKPWMSFEKVYSHSKD